MPEAISSQLSAGAGNYYGATWPPRDTYRINGTDPGGVIRDRLGATDPQGATLSYNVNGNRGYNANVNGRAGATIGATVAGAPNGIQWSFQPWVMTFARRGIGVTAVPPRLQGIDQFGAYSVMMIASFQNPAGALGAAVDNGLEVTTAGSVTLDDGQSLRLGTPGFGFRVFDTGSLEVFIRPQAGGAVQRQTIRTTAADGYEPGDWHSYEIRCLAANGPVEAIAKFFVDGVLAFSQSWGPGNVMPEINGNQSGFRCHVNTNGGSAVGFTVDQAVFKSARDELNLQ